MNRLHGLNAVVTGANQGLGLEIARQFLDAGANVALCARDGVKLAEAADELRRCAADGQLVFAQSCDVSVPDEVERFVRASRDALGSIQALVNNAGVYGPKGPSESVDWDEWTRAIEINLHGVFLPCRALIPHFREQGKGKIVNLSGGGATSPLPRLSAYAASKVAVVRLTETLAEELRADRIDVNAVAPGALNTRLLDEVLEAGPELVGESFYARAVEQKETGGVPLERGAQLCVYLASTASDGITGKLLSAKWDPWATLEERLGEIGTSDIYTLRRIVPKDRGLDWG